MERKGIAIWRISVDRARSAGGSAQCRRHPRETVRGNKNVISTHHFLAFLLFLPFQFAQTFNGTETSRHQEPSIQDRLATLHQACSHGKDSQDQSLQWPACMLTSQGPLQGPLHSQPIQSPPTLQRHNGYQPPWDIFNGVCSLDQASPELPRPPHPDPHGNLNLFLSISALALPLLPHLHRPHQHPTRLLETPTPCDVH